MGEPPWGTLVQPPTLELLDKRKMTAHHTSVTEREEFTPVHSLCTYDRSGSALALLLSLLIVVLLFLALRWGWGGPFRP